MRLFYGKSEIQVIKSIIAVVGKFLLDLSKAQDYLQNKFQLNSMEII